MSWHFSRALVEEYSAATSSDGEPSALLNGNPTQQLYLPSDRMTAFSRLSRFGMTFAPLTDDLGEELLTWFREGFPARTSAPPAEVQDSTANGRDSGAKWPASLAKYDPDSRSWKTAQFSLLGDLEPFSETWPRWGMTADGEFFPLPTPERRTSVKGSGLWASPASADAVGSHGGGQGRSLRTDIHNWKRGNWPTPDAQIAKHGTATEWELNRDGHQKKLHVEVIKAGGQSTPPTYPTPRSSEAEHSGRKAANHSGQTGLSESVKETGQLNPEWVEWLMGWPLGWTDLKPLEMARFQRWLDSHGGL